MPHFPRERDDGLGEYVVRPKSRRRATVLPVRPAAATESAALPRSAERGATPTDDEPAAGDGAAGRKGRGKDAMDDAEMDRLLNGPYDPA